MNNNYADVLESYMIPASELWVSYSQKYDENHKSSEKLALDDFNIVIVNENNYKAMMQKYKHLGLPLFNKKKFLKDGCTWVKIFTKDNKKVVASAEIFNADLAKRMGIAKYDIEPYNESKSHLNDLSIRKEFQGKGLGRQIFKFLVNKFNIGYVETYNDGEVATKLYQSEGFKVYYKDDDCYHMKK
jgi:ribosomal protein S18 acetylase RimI-like enzyme